MRRAFARRHRSPGGTSLLNNPESRLIRTGFVVGRLGKSLTDEIARCLNRRWAAFDANSPAFLDGDDEKSPRASAPRSGCDVAGASTAPEAPVTFLFRNRHATVWEFRRLEIPRSSVRAGNKRVCSVRRWNFPFCSLLVLEDGQSRIHFWFAIWILSSGRFEMAGATRSWGCGGTGRRARFRI